jgi:hypothetical protein
MSSEEQILTTLGVHLTSGTAPGESVSDTADRMDGSQLRYAFMALLAVNVFVLSGAACFAVLYFLY